MTVRIDKTVTNGTFTLDGETFDVDNNVYVIGDDEECLVVDAPHDARAIADLVGDRRVIAIVATHAHDDHVAQVYELQELLPGTPPVLLHRDDLELWAQTHPGREPEGALEDGQVLMVGDTQVQVLHTPGHTWGSCCLYVPSLETVLTADTLFQGGPGATGRSFSDYPTIVASIREKLFTLPEDTTVRTGHGDETTIKAELGNVPDEKPEG